MVVFTRLPDRNYTHIAGCWCCAMTAMRRGHGSMGASSAQALLLQALCFKCWCIVACFFLLHAWLAEFDYQRMC